MKKAAECGTRGGYRRHKREGTDVCGPCHTADRDYKTAWERAKRAKQRERLEALAALEAITPEQHRRNTAEYEAFIQGRRSRGIPPEGIAA